MDWNQVIQTGEAKIELPGCNEQTYVRRTKGTGLCEKNICLNVAHGGGSIMYLGCVAGGTFHRERNGLYKNKKTNTKKRSSRGQ